STTRCSRRSLRRLPGGRLCTSAAQRRSSRPSQRCWSGSATSRTESEPNALDQREAEMDSRMLDGNAVAGLLQEVFAAEMTTAMGTCAGCGASEPIGAVHVFHGAGVVLRCPHCHNTLVPIVRSNRDITTGLGGVRVLKITPE